MHQIIQTFLFSSALLFSLNGLFAQSNPLLGYVEMTEVCLVIHTKDFQFQENSNQMELEYWIETKPKEKILLVSENIDKSRDNTYHFILKDLIPGTSYNYSYGPTITTVSKEVYSFKTQTLWQHRTEPPAFRVATGSCAYINEKEYDRPGEPYGSDYFIFDTIVSKKPDMMLWLGDNIYLREVDYMSESGIVHRYNHTRGTPELKKLLSYCPNYAIWDDHDFGPNDSNGSYSHKDLTLDAFRQYWGNPPFGIKGAEKAITTSFQFMDIDFFLLDNRSNRTSPDIVGVEKPTILGEAQINWLVQALKFSQSPYKIVAMGGQFLNTEAKFENYAVYNEERTRIIKLIENNNISGVVFLTGDRHCTELSELKLSNGKIIYDLTVSPLTSHSYDNTKEANTLRVEGTLVPKANFATLDFSGTKKERKLTVIVYDNKGAKLWSKELE